MRLTASLYSIHLLLLSYQSSGIILLGPDRPGNSGPFCIYDPILIPAEA